MSTPINRRSFLARASLSTAGGLLATGYPALVSAAAAHAEHLAAGTLSDSLISLSMADATTIDAITGRIVPSEGEGPGAREARVVNFIDQGLTGVLQEARVSFDRGLAEFNAAFSKTRSDQRSFSNLSAPEQDAFLTTQEDTAFFGLLQFFTSVGMFALPSYGGNANLSGWRLIGFEDVHAFAPPFGHYDRDYPGYEAVAASYQREGAVE